MATRSLNILVGARNMTGPGLRGVERGLERLKSLALRLSLVLGGGLGMRQAIMAGASFEQQMARVLALTNANEKQFEALENQAKELGRTTQFSATQAADAMAFFGLAGFEVDQILQAMQPTLELAASGQLEIAQAADITAKIMAGMQIPANELGDAVDQMAKAFTTANTDLVQLGEAMKFVGPVGQSTGKSLAELLAAIQALSDGAIQGEMAGTALRQILIKLSAPSEKAQRIMKQLGIEVLDTAGDLLPLTDIIGRFESALQGMGGGERLGVLAQIFEARAATGFTRLLQVGNKELGEMEKRLDAAGGTSKRIARIMMDTLQGTWIRLKSAAEGLGITITETFVVGLRIALESVTAFVNAINTGFPIAARFARELLETIGEGFAITFGKTGIVGILETFRENFRGIFKDLGFVIKNWRTLLEISLLKGVSIASEAAGRTLAKMKLLRAGIPLMMQGEFLRDIATGRVKTTVELEEAAKIAAGEKTGPFTQSLNDRIQKLEQEMDKKFKDLLAGPKFPGLKEFTPPGIKPLDFGGRGLGAGGIGGGQSPGLQASQLLTGVREISRQRPLVEIRERIEDGNDKQDETNEKLAELIDRIGPGTPIISGAGL